MNARRTALTAALTLAAAFPAAAQMVTGSRIPGYFDTFGLPTGRVESAYSVQFITSSVPGSVAWPGDQPAFTFQLASKSDQPLALKGRVDLIQYGTRGRPGDIWVPDMFRIAEGKPVPLAVSLPPKGFTNLTVQPRTPAVFGAYALVADFGPHGRQFVASFVRTFKPADAPVRFPQLCLDVSDIPVLKRLGAFPNRIGIGYKPTTDPDFEDWFRKQGEQLVAYQQAGLPITVEIGGGSFFGPTQPLGRPRPWLDAKDTMQDTKFDLAWLPSYDEDFRKFVKRFVSAYGWPKGPMNGLKLWNEPWNGISISGWGADDERYREIFRVLCEAAREACREAGVEVLLGGCDSSSNTFDKLFGDGRDDWLQYLDFCSIHYQGMSPPSTVKKWVDRQHPFGRVRIWDTESWVANCDDRVAAVVAVNLSTGHDRAVGVYGGNICTEWHSMNATIRGEDGKNQRIQVMQTWSVAAAVGAVNHFIGERRFSRLLFTNGLPWVLVFDGRPGADGQPDPEDGTVVVVGDIGDEFGHDHLLFRTARGFQELAHKEALRKQLAALPAGAPEKERQKLEEPLRTPETLGGAALTLRARADAFSLYDFYGNPVARKGREIVVPLDGRGFFLRGDGKPGSFASLLEAVRTARVEGLEPLATVCRDLTAPVEQKPVLRLELTGVLNRPVTGTLRVTLGSLTLEPAAQDLTVGAHETKMVELKVTGGQPTANNTYPLTLTFDAGQDGRAVHEEDLHVNWIAKRTVAVDGRLDDWKGALPQPIVVEGVQKATLMESAWLPFMKFDEGVTKGLASAYLAYDQDFFYFAARVADDTPEDGMVRFETRNDDDYFYPATSYVVRIEKPHVAPQMREDTAEPRPLVWPEGVRRYSYRQNPELPAGNFPRHDNVQIAFNVLPPDQKDWHPCPPGTMPGYIGYRCTDYEYALNPVASRYGGGAEIWRLQVPGMPHKHFYPRQPKSPLDGAVRDGKLAVAREGNTRIVEAALPWKEIPHVKAALDAGRPVKFSYRVNDNDPQSGCMELSRQRSVAKRNGSFTVDWTEHWANELEFGWEQ
jgi:hypothetical protein